MDHYTSDSSDSDADSSKVIDLAYLLLDQTSVENKLEEYNDEKESFLVEVEKAILHHNRLSQLPENLVLFRNISTLDISSNGLRVLPNISVRWSNNNTADCGWQKTSMALHSIVLYIRHFCINIADT
ncbi:unnamed protein product [Acanthoscelides obtectus]|nr:unnamed protein product [Acanthoscelides obtectus]CAK1648997.1 hypothetical protein AOBTE_LOCUS15993 [Acanthoscelides obtectus]